MWVTGQNPTLLFIIGKKQTTHIKTIIAYNKDGSHCIMYQKIMHLCINTVCV